MPDEESAGEAIEVRMIWPLEDGIQPVYANQFSISSPGSEIVLGFGAFLPNSFSNRPNNEVKEYLLNAPVKLVAKVIISQHGLQAFYNLLTNYLERQSEKGEQEEK